MILVVAGTQFPFDRLVMAVDRWATKRNFTDVVAQVGNSDYAGKTIKTHKYIDAVSFRKLQEKASIIIGHAGMGTILGAMELDKPLIIMPRLHSLGEHRNDHQLSTVERFRGKPGIFVAADADEVEDLLDRKHELLSLGVGISRYASPELIFAIQQFIQP